MPRYPVHQFKGSRARMNHPGYSLKPSDGVPGSKRPPVASGAMRQRQSQGMLTGAPRPEYPRVFRRFGMNTRERVYKLPDTGILDNCYDAALFKNGPGPSSLIPEETRTALGQGGCPSVTHGVRSLAPGGHHWLFSTTCS